MGKILIYMGIFGNTQLAQQHEMALTHTEKDCKAESEARNGMVLGCALQGEMLGRSKRRARKRETQRRNTGLRRAHYRTKRAAEMEKWNASGLEQNACTADVKCWELERKPGLTHACSKRRKSRREMQNWAGRDSKRTKRRGETRICAEHCRDALTRTETHEEELKTQMQTCAELRQNAGNGDETRTSRTRAGADSKRTARRAKHSGLRGKMHSIKRNFFALLRLEVKIKS
ncbi:uncharacterized protein LOC118349450 [Juglans regia]|uniref:Uncharacterized protein LOC118349450 n=1 Tax=Juglans regia TaxID=51240 RepID=A0A6P9F1I3_JUGRE|nr:uncharacterized protein LOC118349450 [Juglans regia]